MSIEKNRVGTVLVISDLHSPFLHLDTVPFLSAIKRKYSPGLVIQIGDLVDLHSLSSYNAEPEADSIKTEIEKAVKELAPIYRMFPRVKMVLGNHDIRIAKKAAGVGIPKFLLKDLREIYQIPKGWDISHKWFIDGVVYEHGTGLSGKGAANKAAMTNMRDTVIGHVHSNVSISYIANSEHLIWGLSVGALIDNDSYAMKYGRAIRNKPIVGVGIIKNGIPLFHPMNLSNSGRWSKKL